MKTLAILCLVAMPTIALAEDGTPGAHFIESWDLNADGTVTADELREKRGDVFFTFDSDENGFLDAEEYVYFDDARKVDMEQNAGHGYGQGQGRMNRVADGMALEANDMDGDGAVSRDEFLGQVDAWLAMIDRDGDGVVTSRDFGPRA